MLVVGDTSTLSNFAIIGKLDPLRQQIGEMLMPPAVAAEWAALRHSHASAALIQAARGGWLTERSHCRYPHRSRRSFWASMRVRPRRYALPSQPRQVVC